MCKYLKIMRFFSLWQYSRRRRLWHGMWVLRDKSKIQDSLTDYPLTNNISLLFDIDQDGGYGGGYGGYGGYGMGYSNMNNFPELRGGGMRRRYSRDCECLLFYSLPVTLPKGIWDAESSFQCFVLLLQTTLWVDVRSDYFINTLRYCFSTICLTFLGSP